MILDEAEEEDTIQHSSLNTEENQILKSMKMTKDPIS